MSGLNVTLITPGFSKWRFPREKHTPNPRTRDITSLTEKTRVHEAWQEWLEVDENEYSRGNLTEHVENGRIWRLLIVTGSVALYAV